MKSKEIIFKATLSVVSILLSLVALEIGLRVYRSVTPAPPDKEIDTEPEEATSPVPQSQPAAPKPIPLHITTDSPVLYQLNPAHPKVSAQGLRNRPVTMPKPEGVYRILVLGDSVAYGHDVTREQAFPMQLEARLRQRNPSIEVINGAVSGYTAYNELQFYLTRGRELEPDLVLLAFCMNDIANPRLHWNYTEDKITDIPDEAIPNIEYDRVWAMKKLGEVKEERAQQAKETPTFWQRTALYKTLKPRIDGLLEDEKRAEVVTSDPKDKKSEVPPMKLPRPRWIPGQLKTYITGEDALSLKAYFGKNSPEFAWLTGIYDRLNEAVQADGATLVIALLPLGYQLDENYPFFPQKRIMAYCNRNDIFCIDLFPALRRHGKHAVFKIYNGNYLDNWHLSVFGHRVAADALGEKLEEHAPYLGLLF